MSASGSWAGSERTVPSHPHRSSRRINYVDLTLAECQTLLESRDIGRIGWNAGHGPQILPVSYACVGELIVFRTSPFGVLSELVRPTQVVFEVDDLDATQHTGWSVIARGRGQAVASPALLTHLWTVDGAEPWAGGVRNVFIGITVERLTGRSFGSQRVPSAARRGAH
jgi:nitroimidazol reductase NimA-like FMN-containing flavoprotein (pyridoxamine 5'-phosphate oxidase superfamily)